MGRRGRKRKDGPRRKGVLIRKDARAEPTPQVKARRAWFSQTKLAGSEDYPLGVMLINDVISEKEHQNLCQVAWLHLVLFGRPSLAASYHEASSQGRSTRAYSSTDDIEKRYKLIREGLGDELYDLLRDIIIFDKMPRWLLPMAPCSDDLINYENFRVAVCRLTKTFSGDKR